MAGKRKVTVEQPGAALEQASGDPVDVAVAAENALSRVDAMTPKQESRLQADLAATAALVGSPAALDWSDLSNGLTPMKSSPNPDDALPLTADPALIDKPVLTKGGWVIPENDPRSRIGLR